MPADPIAMDRKFVKDITESSAVQMDLGKLAQEKGSSPAVKEFGKRMVEDNTKAGEELRQAATQAQIKVPPENLRRIRKSHDKLARLSGRDFDRAFAKMMISDQRANVKEFENQAKGGNAPEVRAFAAKALPTLQEHKKMAEQIGGEQSDSADRQAR